MKTIVVDEEDKVLGIKDYQDITRDDIYRVAGLWVTNSKGQALLAQRKLGKRNDPGKWGPAAAGTVEPGETYEENIYKEAREEIGIKGVAFRPGPKLRNQTGAHRFFVQWFLCRIDWPVEEFKIQEEEVEKIEWVDTERLKKELADNPGKFIAGAALVWKNFL